MKKELSKIICIACILLYAYTAHAQTLEEISAKFDGRPAVIQNYTRSVEISMRSGQPFAETKTEIEILALDEKANGMYNRYKVFHSSFSEMHDLDAYTKVPDGKKFRTFKVSDFKTQNSRDNSVFYDDVKETSFDFPSLVKGAVAHVSYSQDYKDVHLLSPFYCITYLPVLHENFSVSYPSDMEIKYSIKNDDNKIVKVAEDNKGRQHTVTFTAENVDTRDRFGNAPAYAYFEPHIIVQLASYKDDDGKTVNFLGNLDDLYQWNYAFLSKMDNSANAQLKHLADSLTNGITSEEEKARRIYQWVQSNIKYVAFEDGLEGFIPRPANLVCTRKFGDCKDMSSALTTLLQLAGLKAYFTWIGTRDIPYDYTDVSLPIVDNHMICTVNINGKWIFLDGTDPNCIFGLPSSAIQSKQALVAISDKEYKVLRVPEVEQEKNTIVDSTFISITGSGIKGSSSVYYNGYWGNDVYNRLMFSDANDTKNYVKQRMGKASNKFILGDYTISKISNDDKLINIKAGFEVPDYSKKVADELFINMNLEKFFTTEIIDTAKRKVAVENEYKYVIKQYTILDVPEDYKISYVPKDYSYSTDNFGFAIKYTQQQNKIIATQEIRNNYLMMPPKDFTVWNTALKQLFTQYKEQVVLEKK